MAEQQPGHRDDDPDGGVPGAGVRDYGGGRAVAGDAHAPGGQHAPGQAATTPAIS